MITREAFSRERNLFLFCSLGVVVAATAVTLTLAEFNILYFGGTNEAVTQPVTYIEWAVKLILVYLTYRFARFLRHPWWSVAILCILAPLGIFFVIPFFALLISAWTMRRSLTVLPPEPPVWRHGPTQTEELSSKIGKGGTGTIEWPTVSPFAAQVVAPPLTLSAPTLQPDLPAPPSRSVVTAARVAASPTQAPAKIQPILSPTRAPSMPTVTPTATSTGLIITPDFERALQLIESDVQCIFVTGKAGTGKSSLLRLLRERTARRCVFLAPTGLAAVNIGGQTIHSFFKFPPRTLTDEDIKVVRNAELFEALEMIVIDEVSMVRADMMDAIDRFLQLNRCNMDAPFGAVKMVFFGDLHQLPPIVREKEEEDYLNDRYDSPYFFDAQVFDDCHPHLVELRRIFRQSDPVFLDVLANVRVNSVTDDHLRMINGRCEAAFEPPLGSTTVTLTPDNNLAAQINRERLARLAPPQFKYDGILEGQFDEKSYPADYCLHLRVGAVVMFVKNDMNRRWVNGTMGRVVGLTDSSITVEVDSNSEKGPSAYPVERDKWESIRYRYDRTKRTIVPEVVGSFQQYPLKLAWAITIHKSQGMTFDRLVLDMGRGAFAHGQTYVALSRCRSLEGITLRKPLRRADIRLDRRIERLHSRCVAYDAPMAGLLAET